MITMTSTIRITIYLALALALTSPASADNPYTGTKVEEIFGQLCAQCHGAELRGGLGTSLVDGQWNNGGTDEAISQSILAGNTDMGMPPFRDVLAPDQLRAMIILIRERETQEAQATSPPPKPKAETITRTQYHPYRMETLVPKGLSTPWAIAFLPDGRKLVTEIGGSLRLVGADWTLNREPVDHTPTVMCFGQGGLLDVALHPDFAANGWIYLAFSDGRYEKDRRHALTAIVRGRIIDNRWSDQQWIYRADEKFHSGAGQHFGSRIAFRDGYIFFVVGERGGGMQAQDITRPNGKIFRLHDDGRVPADNPFVSNTNAIPGIWTYGHRNPQGLVFDSRNGDLYDTEHGPRGGDELNLLLPGRNYGWPVICHGMNYDGTPLTSLTAQEGMEQPVTYWTPSIAPCGLEFYEGSRFPNWKYDLFAGSLKAEELHRLRLRNHKVIEQEIVLKGIGRIRDVASGPDGFLYLVLNAPDRIVRLIPAE